MPDRFTPQREHKFTFGLWTVGNIGRDPFGEPVREPLSPVELVHLLADVGTYGVNFHDNDLVPIIASPAKQARIMKASRATQWNADGEIQGLLAEIAADDGTTEPFRGAYSRQKAEQLKAAVFDRAALGAWPLAYEKLDQLTVELLLGVR